MKKSGSTRRADRDLIDELRRFARGEAYDEQPVPGLDSEALDFRAASELFAPVRRLRRTDLQTLRLVTTHQGRHVPTVGGMLLFGENREQYFPDAWIQAGRFHGVDKSQVVDHTDADTRLFDAVVFLLVCSSGQAGVEGNLEDEMIRTKSLWLGGGAAVFLAGFVLGSAVRPWDVVHAQSNARVFELRTYTAPEGKLDALSARFRDHTQELFKKHGITSVGYFLPQDAPQSQNTFIYILAHPDRQTAQKNWAAFQADPEWRKALAESQPQGPLQTKVESVFINPTDYSPLK